MLELCRTAGLSLLIIGSSAVQGAAEAGAMSLSSSAFEEGGSVPVRYTCQGEDVSPPLAWSALPADAKALALVVDDPDAPGGSWVHWVVYNLSPEIRGLPEGASHALPGDSAEGLNGWGRADYGGPCPPSGEHRYVFGLYALDAPLSIDRPSAQALRAAMTSHVLARVELTAVYAKR